MSCDVRVVRPSKTLTATAVARLATPNCVPAAMPATCVPCPTVSSVVTRGSAVKPNLARPPKSVWW